MNFRTVWKWTMVLVIVCGALWLSRVAKAQTVYISTLGQPQPSLAKVQGAIADANAALHTNITFGGYTNEPCVNAQITFRTPGLDEWQAYIGGPHLDTVASTPACRPELDYSGSVALLNPVDLLLLGDPPQNVYTHELFHGLGAHHVADPNALMWASNLTATKPQPADVQSIVDCLVRVDADGTVHIPSSYTFPSIGYTLMPNNGEWYVTSSFVAPFYCPKNYQTANDYALNEVLMPSGLRFNVLMQPMPDGGWALKSASQY